jgi:acetolactate synthase I/II/III large subunit
VRVYEAIAEVLDRAEVERLFGVMGDASMRFLSSFMDRRPGAYVGTAHEAGAVAMADGYSRLTRRLGVASVTHGPGMTNGLTALTNAVRANSQLLLLTGSTPPQREHLQRLDLRAAAGLAGAEYHEALRAEDVVDDLVLAMRAAVLNRHPVVLNIPVAFMASEVVGAESSYGLGPWRPDEVAPAADRFDEAVGVIATADRPLIVVGRGVVNAGLRDKVVALAEALDAPVATTVMAKGLMSGYPLDLGICGSQASSLATKYISQADCLIALGAGLNAHTTASGDLFRGKTVVHVDATPAVAGGRLPVTVAVTSDVRPFVEQALEAVRAIGQRHDSAWATSLRQDLAAFDSADDFVDQSNDSYVDLRSAMIALDNVLPAERALVTDAGHFMSAPWRHLGCSPSAFTHSGSYGAIGLGLPMAIGAAFANLDRLTVGVHGDGGLMMSIQELCVAVEHQLPMVIAVANDRSYGSEYHKLAEWGHNPDHALCTWPSFADMARGFGAEGVVITRVQQIYDLKPQLGELRTPLLLDVRTDPSADCRDYK